MKALLYKDMVSAKTTYLLALAIMLAIAGYAVYHGAMIIIPFLFAFMPVILNAASFGNEAQSDFPKFVFTTPISRKAYVASKYILAVLFATMALISGLILFYLEHKSLNYAFVIAASSFAVPIIFSSFQIPFILKFGVEKGRIIVVAAYFLLFAITSYLGDTLSGFIHLVTKISQLNTYVIAGALIAAAILILTVSNNIGVSIMKRKEY